MGSPLSHAEVEPLTLYPTRILEWSPPHSDAVVELPTLDPQGQLLRFVQRLMRYFEMHSLYGLGVAFSRDRFDGVCPDFRAGYPLPIELFMFFEISFCEATEIRQEFLSPSRKILWT